MRVMTIFFPQPDNEPTFSSSFFQEGPIVNVENIEERLKEMNLRRVQKREKNYHLKNMTKIGQFNINRGKQHFPISHTQL